MEQQSNTLYIYICIYILVVNDVCGKCYQQINRTTNNIEYFGLILVCFLVFNALFQWEIRDLHSNYPGCIVLLKLIWKNKTIASTPDFSCFFMIWEDICIYLLYPHSHHWSVQRRVFPLPHHVLLQFHSYNTAGQTVSRINRGSSISLGSSPWSQIQTGGSHELPPCKKWQMYGGMPPPVPKSWKMRPYTPRLPDIRNHRRPVVVRCGKGLYQLQRCNLLALTNTF